MLNASGFINEPMILPIIAIGNRTTIFVPALARTAINASLEPILDASLGSPVLSSRFTIASSTTIELVTRIPTDIPIAISVDILRE